MVPTLLLPRALLEMLESLLATISTSLAKIPMHVELSSPVRQLGEVQWCALWLLDVDQDLFSEHGVKG